ncbi:hypothetical protein DUI70_1140 [Streptomyces albus]|nr:hypothetical protein DUI70_1140 [Streptomyces albus]
MGRHHRPAIPHAPPQSARLRLRLRLDSAALHPGILRSAASFWD